MNFYLRQEHWIVNSVFEGYAKEGRICTFWKREEHAKVNWAGCGGPVGAPYGRWDLGEERAHMAVQGCEKAICANEEGRACVADETLEDPRCMLEYTVPELVERYA